MPLHDEPLDPEPAAAAVQATAALVERLALPGPRILWWLLGSLALLLPLLMIAVSGLQPQPKDAAQLEFALREQMLNWRTLEYSGWHTDLRERKDHRAAAGKQAENLQQWWRDQLAQNNELQHLFDDAALLDAAPQPVATADEKRSPSARDVGKTPLRLRERVVAQAVAMREDAQALTLITKISNPSLDLRAALAALPETPTATAMGAAQALQQVQNPRFGKTWSAYTRDRVRARVLSLLAEPAAGRKAAREVEKQDSSVIAGYSTAHSALVLCGIFGLVTLVIALIRGQHALANGLPRWSWVKPPLAGLPRDKPYPMDPLVLLLGFSSWLIGFLAVSLLGSVMPGPRAAPGFATLLQSTVGILLAQAVVQAFAKQQPGLQAAARWGGPTTAAFLPTSVLTLRAFCLLLPFVVIAAFFTELLFAQGVSTHPVALHLLGEADAMQLAATGFAVIVAAPIGEELMFRGFLYRWLRQRHSIRLALWATSALFALLHLAPHAVLIYTTLGLAFGLVYEWAGSLWAPILLHSLWNLAVFVSVVAITLS